MKKTIASIAITGAIVCMAASQVGTVDEKKQGEVVHIDNALEPSIIKKNVLASEDIKKEAIRRELEKKRLEELRQRQLEIERQKELERQRLEAQRIQEQKRKAELAAKQRNTYQSNVMTFTASHYISTCSGCSGVTATGYNVKNTIYYQGYRIVAVDPSIIPLNSIVEVSTPYGTFKAIAADKGGAIKGKKLDVLVSSYNEAVKLGVVKAQIRVIKYGNK